MDEQLPVKKGDYFGFTWLKYGVIKFDLDIGDNYCGARVNALESTVVELIPSVQRIPRRIYSIKLHVQPEGNINATRMFIPLSVYTCLYL